jgi:tRNA(Ile)-lysidine synthase
MHKLAQRMLKAIRQQELLRASDRVAVAVSGGADSVALLLLLLEVRGELGISLSVAHVNHKLRGAESDEDERFVARLAAEHGLELSTCAAPVEHARGTGIEAAARTLRYEFFRQLATQSCVSTTRARKVGATNPRADKVATAHTLDDQAETILLRIFRGTGIRGLAGILPRLHLPCPVPQSEERISLGTKQGVLGTRYQLLDTNCEVVRPLLSFRRAELREYLRQRRQTWREDSSNQDAIFLRNRLRQRLMPLIVEDFGPAAIERITELAEIARAEEAHWAAHSGISALVSAAPLPTDELLALPLAAARRTVRGWLEQNAPATSTSFHLVDDILDLARGPAGRKIVLPGTAAFAEPANESSTAGARARVTRNRKELVLEPSSPGSQNPKSHNYEYTLPVPGAVFIPELGVGIAAEEVDVASVPEKNRRELLDPARLGNELTIRNWRPGDRFWPAHTRQGKKVKELLSDRHATGSEKKRWPVAMCRSELVWVRGFAAPKAWQPRSSKAIWVHETAAS